MLGRPSRSATVEASNHGAVEVVRDFIGLLRTFQGAREDVVRLMSERFLDESGSFDTMEV